MPTGERKTGKIAKGRLHPHRLSAKKTGLLIIDIQERSVPEVPHVADIVENIVKLALTFDMFKRPIVVSEHCPEERGRTVRLLQRHFPNVLAVKKTEFDCTECDSFWHFVGPLALETMVVCGIETHAAVGQTALGLMQRGLRVHVVTDAVGSRYRNDSQVALRKMEQAGVIPATTEMCLLELIEKTGTKRSDFIRDMITGRPRVDEESRQRVQLSVFGTDEQAEQAPPAGPDADLPWSASFDQLSAIFRWGAYGAEDALVRQSAQDRAHRMQQEINRAEAVQAPAESWRIDFDQEGGAETPGTAQR
jgi:nicotinamidase-related amidase